MFMSVGEDILVGSRDGVVNFVRGSGCYSYNIVNGYIYVDSKLSSYDDLNIVVLRFYEIIMGSGCRL